MRRYNATGIVFPETPLLPGSAPLKCGPMDRIEDTDARRVHCARYGNCLDYAASLAWSAWSCTDCSADEVLSIDQLREDSDRMAALLAEVAGPRAVRLRHERYWRAPMQIRRRKAK